MDVAGIAVDLPEGPAEPTGESAGIQLGRDDNPPADDVQPPGEPQQRRHLGATTARFAETEPAQLFFHRRGHHHAGNLSTRLQHRSRSGHTDSVDAPVRRGHQRWVDPSRWGPQVAGCRSLSR